MIDMVLEQIEAYLDGGVSFEELERWVAANLEALSDEGDWDVVVFVNDLDGDLMDVSQGRLAEDAFKALLRERIIVARSQGGAAG